MQLSWLKKEFHLNLRIHPGGLLLAVLYAFAYWIARGTSVDQFYLPAGVRVAALLLTPPRFWPYLIAGEYLFFAQARYPLIDKYGLAWAVIASGALMPTVALIVHAHRRWMRSGNLSWMLSIAATAAIAVTALNQGLAYLLMPTQHDAVSWTGVLRYAIGDYLGILVFAPLAVIWTRRHLAVGAMQGWVIASVVAVAIVGANVLIGLTMETTGLPGSFNDTAFTAQQVLVLAGTTMLLLGSTLAHYYRQFRLRDRVAEHMARLVRTAHLSGEQDRRERVTQMTLIGDDIHGAALSTADWLSRRGHAAPASDILRQQQMHSRLLREQVSMVYPVGLEHAGLYVAVRAGGIADTWAMSARVMQPRLIGNPCRMSLGLQLAAYRTLVDAVALLLEHERGSLQVRARCGRHADRHLIVLSVALLDPRRQLGTASVEHAYAMLSARALAYAGQVRCRARRISVMLLEPAALANAAGNPPEPLTSAAMAGRRPDRIR